MSQRAKLILCLLLVVGACAVLYLETVNFQTQTGEGMYKLLPASSAPMAPNFTLTDVQTNKPVALSSLYKKGPVVLDFWATWCGNCRAEFPEMKEIEQKYKGRVQFYGIDNTDPPLAIKAFSQQQDLPFETLSDRYSTVSSAYGVTGIPHMVVIDQTGHVRLVLIGYDPSGSLAQQLPVDLDQLDQGNS